MRYITTVNDREYLVEIIDERHVSVDGCVYNIDFLQIGNQPVYSLIVEGMSYEAHAYPDEEHWQILIQGRLYMAAVEDERERRLRAHRGSVAPRGEFHLKAPMPGMVVTIPVQEGQSVAQGDVLLILESMKMQNELRAPKAGVVSRIRVAAGDRVEQKQTLLSVV